MSNLSAMSNALLVVPEGPLHPSLAVAGIVVGVSAAVVAGPGLRRWLLFVVGAAAVLISATADRAPHLAFTDHADRAHVLATSVAILVAAALARMPRSTATLVALAGCAGVWAIVPDTEVPLLGGAVLLGAGVIGAIPGWLPDRRSVLHSSLLLLPLAGASWGSIGRPSRFTPAIAVGAVTVMLALAVRALARTARRSRGRSSRRARAQRAGTPMTVDPAATSSTTTAPAPTTAF
ncbi:MAG: hypothetical protein RIB98_06915 [Acidimicrobiales bacterium]